MCTLHKAPSTQKPPEHLLPEEPCHPYLAAWLLIIFVFALKVSLLLAFCYLHASMEEAPHEHYETYAPMVKYQKKTLC